MVNEAFDQEVVVINKILDAVKGCSLDSMRRIFCYVEDRKVQDSLQTPGQASCRDKDIAPSPLSKRIHPEW